jgi:tetratricopeptide (TPR) repeat protein
LHAWFPQLIDGAWLVKGAARLENSDEESFFRSAISNPRDVLRALEECESDASLRCLLACFAADWQALLMHALDHENESLASGDLEQVASARSMKLTALYRLRRYEEALALANRIGADADEPDGAATARAACLVRLERYRDALDVIESANVENHLRLQFWRACASLGAGEREQSAEAYERYEGQCGPDIRGTKLLRSIMKKIEPPVPPLSLGENTESA